MKRLEVNTFRRHWNEMWTDAGCVQWIVRWDFVLPYVRDAHKLASLGIVFDMDPMLDICGFANVDNLFRMTLAPR